MKKLRNWALSVVLIAGTLLPVRSARADLFGGDIAVLVQILAQAMEQLIQLKSILANGEDTLGLLRDINAGIRDGLRVIQIFDPKLNPGLYGNQSTALQVLATLEQLYGKVPQTQNENLQKAQDQSVAESIAMNANLYTYADSVDVQVSRILEHAKNVSPQGAAKLQAESIAVLIGVTTQMLRTNSAMLKVMAQNMALENRKDKIQSQQFRTQYNDLSNSIRTLPKNPSLSELDR